LIFDFLDGVFSSPIDTSGNEGFIRVIVNIFGVWNITEIHSFEFFLSKISHVIFGHGVGVTTLVVFVDHLDVFNIDGESISFFSFSFVEFSVFSFEVFESLGEFFDLLWVEGHEGSGGSEH